MVTREVKVETSVQAFAKVGVEANGWTEDNVAYLDEFPFEEFEGDYTKKNFVAFGINFDDGGRAAELGSNLRKRIYTLEFFILGMDEMNAKSLANDLKFVCDVDVRIPLLDVGEEGMPVIDALIVVGCSAQKVVVPDPKPYERHVWLTTARVEDEYYPAIH